MHYLTSFYYLFIKLKSVFASLNSKNNGTVQLFNTIFRHRNCVNGMGGYGLKCGKS